MWVYFSSNGEETAKTWRITSAGLLVLKGFMAGALLYKMGSQDGRGFFGICESPLRSVLLNGRAEICAGRDSRIPSSRYATRERARGHHLHAADGAP